MGFKLLPFLLLTLFAGLAATASYQAKIILPSVSQTNAQQAAQAFLAYRNAVVVYQRNNPTFVGTVPVSGLMSQANQISSSFLASAGNAITAFGTSGRVITAYANLPIGAVAAAYSAADNDASIGIASGATWKSFNGSAAVSLATAVPDAATVSVIQTGN